MGKQINIFAYAAHGKGLSGGDRIFIEFARRWSNKNKVRIFLQNEGLEMCRRQGLKGKGLNFEVLDQGMGEGFLFIINYLQLIFRSTIFAIGQKLEDSNEVILYSASEFLMDCFPAVILKFRYPKVVWAASWYQTAPSPFRGFSEEETKRRFSLSALLYWLVQQISKPIISKFADVVLVNNDFEKEQFKNKKAVVVYGAVDLKKAAGYRKQVSVTNKKYDGVFQGRLHPQKGVLEMIEIWKLVADKIPGANLAVIGDGPLMQDVRAKIKNQKLEKNVELFGYVFDGEKKYGIFSQSKVVLHPSFYDSGGMASAEVMVFGIPAVGFDLRAYEIYYPKGMAKVKKGDLKAFAGKVVQLIEDKKLNRKLGSDALKMIESSWSWDSRADEVLKKILKKNG